MFQHEFPFPKIKLKKCPDREKTHNEKVILKTRRIQIKLSYA